MGMFSNLFNQGGASSSGGTSTNGSQSSGPIPGTGTLPQWLNKQPGIRGLAEFVEKIHSEFPNLGKGGGASSGASGGGAQTPTSPDYNATVNVQPGLLGAMQSTGTNAPTAPATQATISTTAPTLGATNTAALGSSEPSLGSFNWSDAGSALAGAGSAVAGLGGLFSGGGMSGAIGKAGDIYKKYLNEGLAELQSHETQGRTDLEDYLNQALGYMQPYYTEGQKGLQDYMASMGLEGGGEQQKMYDQFTASPGYQFALKQGLSSVQRGMQSKGLGGSGAEEKQLQATGQGLADQEYSKYQSQLANLAGMGQQAASTMGGYAYGTGGNLAQLGLGYAGDQSNLYGEMAQAEAEAEMAKAEASQRSSSSLFGGIGSLIGAAGSIASLF